MVWEVTPNVWLGVTCGIASSLNRLDTLKMIPAVLRWVSAEPLLGPIEQMKTPIINNAIASLDAAKIKVIHGATDGVFGLAGAKVSALLEDV